MRAWVVRGEGAPWDVFRVEDVPEPTHAAMERFALDLEGLRVRTAGLAWPDVTMATGA